MSFLGEIFPRLTVPTTVDDRKPPFPYLPLHVGDGPMKKKNQNTTKTFTWERLEADSRQFIYPVVPTRRPFIFHLFFILFLFLSFFFILTFLFLFVEAFSSSPSSFGFLCLVYKVVQPSATTVAASNNEELLLGPGRTLLFHMLAALDRSDDDGI